MLFRPVLVRYFALSVIGSSEMGLSMGLFANGIGAQISGIQFVPPQTEEESDPRDRPRGGGSRPICNPSDPQDLKCIQRQMMALVPQSPSTQASWGLRGSATPMIWFFSPFESDNPVQSSFELIDADGQVVWQDSTVQLPAQPGFFAYQIPAQASLTSGETYRWYLSVQIDPDQPSADVLLTARLTYQHSPQASNLESPPSAESIQRLASQGFWYDTVTALAEISSVNGTHWKNFLRNHGFPDLVEEPIHSP